MQIIDIVPIHYLHLVQNQPMAMFLTHLVENSPEYAKFARNYTGYKILDNSLIELGEAVDIERVLKEKGVFKALRKAGCKNNDIVSVGDVEFEYQDENYDRYQDSKKEDEEYE